MTISSYDALIAIQDPIHRAFFLKVAAGTTANTTSGYISVVRFPQTFTVPSYTTTTQTFMTFCQMVSNQNGGLLMCALETTLGTLTVSGNSFASGSSMPSKTVSGSSVQTASMIPVIVATTALTATTPALTTTYTDQGGTGSNSCVMTLPTSPIINTGFLATPHLASGDTGVRSVSNMSISTGSAGVLKAFGLLPLAFSINSTTTMANGIDPLSAPWPLFPIAAGDVIAIYSFGATTAAIDLNWWFSLAGND